MMKRRKARNQNMSSNSPRFVDILGLGLILYIFYYFLTQVAPLLAETSFGRQFLNSLQTIGLALAVMIVTYVIVTIYANSQ